MQIEPKNEAIEAELAGVHQLDSDLKVRAQPKQVDSSSRRESKLSQPLSATSPSSRPSVPSSHDPELPSTFPDSKPRKARLAVASPDSDSDGLLRAVATRRLQPSKSVTNSSSSPTFAAAKEARDAKQARQRGLLGVSTAQPSLTPTPPESLLPATPLLGIRSSTVSSTPASMPLTDYRAHPPNSFDFHRTWNISGASDDNQISARVEYAAGEWRSPFRLASISISALVRSAFVVS